MVWLDMTSNNGNSLYFVTDRMERLPDGSGSGFVVSGILGDGCYEGEVIVEAGNEPTVTFVDAWLASRDFDRFARSIDRERVVEALTEVAARLARGMNRPGSPIRQFDRGENGCRVAETRIHWRAVA